MKIGFERKCYPTAVNGIYNKISSYKRGKRNSECVKGTWKKRPEICVRVIGRNNFFLPFSHAVCSESAHLIYWNWRRSIVFISLFGCKYTIVWFFPFISPSHSQSYVAGVKTLAGRHWASVAYRICFPHTLSVPLTRKLLPSFRSISFLLSFSNKCDFHFVSSFDRQ